VPCQGCPSGAGCCSTAVSQAAASGPRKRAADGSSAPALRRYAVVAVVASAALTAARAAHHQNCRHCCCHRIAAAHPAGPPPQAGLLLLPPPLPPHPWRRRQELPACPYFGNAPGGTLRALCVHAHSALPAGRRAGGQAGRQAGRSVGFHSQTGFRQGMARSEAGQLRVVNKMQVVLSSLTANRIHAAQLLRSTTHPPHPSLTFSKRRAHMLQMSSLGGGCCSAAGRCSRRAG
jgi:hypothetical protein